MTEPSECASSSLSKIVKHFTSKQILQILNDAAKCLAIDDAAQLKKRVEGVCSGSVVKMHLEIGDVQQVISNKLVARLSKRLQAAGSEVISFGDKSEFFAVLAELLPVHYFEKAPVVRIVWELWITIR